MALSLTNLHLRFLVILLLAVGAIGYASYTFFVEGPAASTQPNAMILAREIARGIDARLQAQRLLAQQVAAAVNTEAILRLPTAERVRRERELAEFLPGSEAANVVNVDKLGARVSSESVSLASLDQLRNAVRTNTLDSARLVLKDGKPAGYMLFVPLGKHGTPPAGYLLVRYAINDMKSFADRAASGVDHLEIRAENDRVALLATGNSSSRPDSAPISTTIGKSGWTLLLWPAGTNSPLVNLPTREASIVFVALAVLLFAGFRLWRRTVRSVRHDVMSLLRMFKDVRDGNMRVDYPLRLQDFSDVYQYLRHSGRKLLKEKKRLKTMGLIDHLSQLSNRRHFDMRLKELFELSKTHGPSSVLIIDVDHFKRVNDEHGHDAGDALVTGFAKALRQCVRQSDLLVRLGGDEFCVVYPYTTLDRAISYAERLRRQLPRDIPLLKGVVHEVRWTGGLSMMAEKDSKFDDVLWRADQALMQAKEAGRNVMRVYDPAKGLDKKQPMAAN